MKDVYGHLTPKLSIAPNTYKANQSGSSVDRQGFEGADVQVVFGARTDGNHSFGLQESDDDSTWADVADGDIQGAKPSVTAAAGASQVYHFGYLGMKRYLRVTSNSTGTTGAAYAAIINLGQPRFAGASQMAE